MKTEIQFTNKVDLISDSQIKFDDKSGIDDKLKDVLDDQLLMVTCRINSPITVVDVEPVTDDFLAKKLTI